MAVRVTAANKMTESSQRTTESRAPAWGLSALLAALLALAANLAYATVVTDLYEASVSSERGQAAAFQDAMRQVIVRITGERDGDSAPALADLISGAQRYVQKYRNLPGNKVTIGFDGAKLADIIAAAGRPVWGRERPVTLVWLVVDDGRGRRHLIGADDSGDVKNELEAAADSRGLPIVWPRLDATDAAHVSANDVWIGSLQRLTDAGARYRADALLIGKSYGGYIDWTLQAAGDTRAIRGGATDGVHAVADRLAEILAATNAEPLRSVSLNVTGVDSLASYADLMATLEASSLVSSVAVTELAGDRVTLALSVRGAADRLRRALATQRKFQQLDDAGADPAILNVRYRP